MLSKIHNLGPRQQKLLALGLGAFAALGFPPVYFILAPFVAFPLWLYLTEVNQQAPLKRHFALGFFFGLGYFTVGLYWITFALGSDISTYWWLVPFAALGIPTGLSVYTGCMAVLLSLTHSRGVSRCFWFAILWTLAELAWGSGQFALPWNPLALIWAGVDPIFQSLSVVGTYGLTLITALLVSLLGPFSRARTILIGSLLLLFVGIGCWGYGRPDRTPLKVQEYPVVVRMVQPCVPLDMNWGSEKSRTYLFELIKLSATQTTVKPNIIVWPESALPLLLGEDETARQFIMERLPAEAYLISGTLRRVRNPGQKVVVYNSLMVVDHQSNVVATYDKHHLVPFGEYVPFRWLIPDSITKITSGDIDFSRGEGSTIIDVKSIPAFSPLICFEGIFSGQVIIDHDSRPEWLLNITNDAWFGHSSGPYQHLQLARMRSIEEGLPLVRSANSGMSAMFDAFGRETARMPLGEKGILDATLPSALQQAPLFAKYGQLIFMVLFAIMIVMALITRRL